MRSSMERAVVTESTCAFWAVISLSLMVFLLRLPFHTTQLAFTP